MEHNTNHNKTQIRTNPNLNRRQIVTKYPVCQKTNCDKTQVVHKVWKAQCMKKIKNCGQIQTVKNHKLWQNPNCVQAQTTTKHKLLQNSNGDIPQIAEKNISCDTTQNVKNHIFFYKTRILTKQVVNKHELWKVFQ